MNRNISGKEFTKEIIESRSLAIVQFRIEWSGACQIISPIYEELARTYKEKARFFTVDVEQETGLDDQYGIIELPTILFFKSGKVIDYITGLVPRNEMIDKIETAIKNRLN